MILFVSEINISLNSTTMQMNLFCKMSSTMFYSPTSEIALETDSIELDT